MGSKATRPTMEEDMKVVPSSENQVALCNNNQECMDLLVQNFSKWNRALFGFEWMTSFNRDTFSSRVLPLEMVMMVLDYLDQPELIQASRTCKTINYLMKSDPYLWSQTTRITKFMQLVKYLEIREHYLNVDFYSGIGQSSNYFDDLKFPFATLCQRTSFRYKGVTQYSKGQPEWVMDYKLLGSVISSLTSGFDRSGTGGMIFSEELIMGRHTVYDIELNNLLIGLLFSIRKYFRKQESQNYSILDFVVVNLRHAMRDLKIYFNKSDRLKLLLRAREKESEEVKPLPIESNEDDLPQPINNTFETVPDSAVGKPPLYYCKYCDFKIAGMACCTCRELLVLEKEGTCMCNKCNKAILRPVCCKNPMQVKEFPWKTAAQLVLSSPNFKCPSCKFTLGGTRCFTCVEGTPSADTIVEGREFQYNHAIRRIAEADVWTCPKACSRRNRGGCYHDSMFTCKTCNKSFTL